MSLIVETALPVVDRKCLGCFHAGRPLAVGSGCCSTCRALWHSGLLPVCHGESGREGTGHGSAAAPVRLSCENQRESRVGKPAASWRLNAAKFMAGAAEQLPRVWLPECHSVTAELR